MSRSAVVPEEDPGIVIERVQIRRLDGLLPAYTARPKQAPHNAPSVVVLMDAWGVDSHIRDVVRRYAKAGYRAIAPDLYGRFGAPSGDAATDSSIFLPFAKRLDRKQCDGDIRASALWATTTFPQTKVGVTGFCLGGHLTLMQAMDNADVFAAAAPFNGSLKDIDPDGIHMPVCGSYGDRDAVISSEDVRAFRAALRVPNDVRIYSSAGNAFFDETRDTFVQAAASDAWKRSLDFFKRFLGGIT